MKNNLDTFVEKIKLHILCTIIFGWKSCRLEDKVVNYGRDRQATDDNTAHASCMLEN